MPSRAQIAQPFKRVERELSRAKSLATTRAASDRMARVRQSGTAPELSVRAAVRSAGLRYTLRNRDLPGSPDLANRSRRFAIFVHGCYWHRHAGCRQASTPKSNRAFWLAKFERNRARDRRAVKELKRLGFRVLVIWECSTALPNSVVDRVSALLSTQSS